jgi:hypothetical protein
MALEARARDHRRMARFTNLLFCVLLTSGAGSACEPPTRAAESAQNEGELEVWIDLSVPPLSTQPAQNRAARAALRARIEKQQEEVMSQLAALGAKESARVIEVRNAIAVRIPAAAIAEARTLSGVVKVREVKHRQRMPGGNSSN